MTTPEKSSSPESSEGFGSGMTACFVVLGLDFLAGYLALLSSGGGRGASIEGPVLVLLCYIVAAVGTGIYGWYYRQRTARLIGICVGLVPVFLIILVLLSVQ